MTIEQLCKVDDRPSQGVVSTHIELVEEIIKSIPTPIKESSTTTFLEPCFGSGTFIFELIRELRRHGHSMENIQSRIYGFEIFGGAVNKVKRNLSNYNFKNIHNTHFLTHDFKNMKFDVVLGNPPYQGFIEGKKGKTTIFDNFIFQGLKITSQFLIMVTPGSFLSTTSRFKTLRKELKNNGLEKIISHNYFKQKIADPIYFLVNKKHTGNILKDNSIIINDKSESPIVIETNTKKLFDKILNLTTSKLKVIQGDSNPKGVFQTNKERYKLSPKAEFIYPYVSNNLKDGFKVIYVAKDDFKPHVKKNQRVILFNERYDKTNHRFSNLRELKNAHTIGFNVNNRGILFEKNDNVEDIKTYLNSKIFRFLIKETSTTNTGMSFKLSIAKQLPDWNNDFTFLTQEDINLIESTIK